MNKLKSDKELEIFTYEIDNNICKIYTESELMTSQEIHNEQSINEIKDHIEFLNNVYKEGYEECKRNIASLLISTMSKNK